MLALSAELLFQLRAVDAGLDLTAITAQLERAGVSAFCDSYRQLLDCIESKLAALPAAPPR